MKLLIENGGDVDRRVMGRDTVAPSGIRSDWDTISCYWRLGLTER